MTIRIPGKYLSMSAAALVALLGAEYYTSTAVIPTQGDRPTVGFGSTFREDGTPVQMGDTIDPVSAVKRTFNHIEKDKGRLGCLDDVLLSQAEYDLLSDFSYQYGPKRTCESSMVRHSRAGNYMEACHAYTLYKYSGGYDCSTIIDGKRNKVCWGVWTRNLKREADCLAGLT